MTHRPWIAGTVLLATVLATCGGDPDPVTLLLEASNGTTLEVTLVVNGQPVAVVAPGTAGGLTASQLPPLPWSVEARTASGRVLIAFDVDSGDVVRVGNQLRGAGGRVDLSCGRLDVWSGPPMLGPVPGPGESGDCEP